MSSNSIIRIDGSEGEGGGQMLRTALSLSMVTGQPFAISNIRAGRERPGLLRQHLTGVLAAAEISSAEVEGANLGSQSLVFRPKEIRAGDYHFAVGTAGSGTLVFQTVLPALMLASGSSTLTIEGGTHNQASPPFDFLDRTFIPFINRMGPEVTLAIERHGFYPAGGGRFHATITPCASLRPLEIGERGDISRRRAIAISANLPTHVASRELKEAQVLFSERLETRSVEATSPGPGNVVLIELESERVTEIFTAFGELGVSAEQVTREAVREAREYLVSAAVAGEHLTDQLLLPFALAGGGTFTALKLTQHAKTNMEIIGLFLPVEFETERTERFTRVRTKRTGR